MVLQANPEHDFNDYDLLKEHIWDDTRRMVLVKEHGVQVPSHCEGQGFKRHACFGGHEMNHVLIPRNVFQKLAPEDQRYFDHEINCALNCSWFHNKHGHTTAYRRWHWRRMVRIFGYELVWAWWNAMPTKEDHAPPSPNGSG